MPPLPISPFGAGTARLRGSIELAAQFARLGDGPIDPRSPGRLCDIRRVEVARIQNAARNAMEWFEVVGSRYADGLEPEQFMYSLLTRSQRISHENLRLRDKAWLEGYERWFARRLGIETPDGAAIPPMFTAADPRRAAAEPSSSRPWPCIRRSMACRTISTWCIWGPALSGVPV
jgi:hypothetical protein